MEEKELVENRLAIELSKGTILDEYLIKFLKSNGSNDFVEEIENSSKLIKRGFLTILSIQRSNLSKNCFFEDLT